MTTEAELIHVCTSGTRDEFKALELTTEQQMVTAGQIQPALAELEWLGCDNPLDDFFSPFSWHLNLTHICLTDQPPSVKWLRADQSYTVYRHGLPCPCD